MIEFRDISFSYNKKPFLSGINLTLDEAKITTIIGPNGCGKSTLLKVGTKLLKANSGSVLLDNKDIKDFSEKEFAKKVAFLPQVTVAPQMTVEELILCGRYPYHSFYEPNSSKDKEIVANAMKLVNCYNLKDKRVDRLSGGESRRVYLGMALAQDTELIILDEPTTYLDVNVSFEIMELIKKLKCEHNKTIIMVLHDINLALEYSDEIVVMSGGKVVCKNTPESLVKSNVIEDVFSVKTHILKGETKNYYCFDRV